MDQNTLQPILNFQNEDLSPLMSHLKSLLKHVNSNISKTNPDQNFEKMSLLVKNIEFEFLKANSFSKNSSIEQNQFINIYSQLPNTKINLENQFIENINTKFEILEQLGKGLCKLEILKIQQAIFDIAKNNNHKEVYFFGKIFALVQDYFVIWVRCQTDPIEGDIINSIKFFISQDLSKWDVLEKITAKNVRQSRNIKALFTGKLSHDISKDMNEAVYLHCVLIRMLFSNLIVPEGVFSVLGDSEKIVERASDFKLDNGKCVDLSGWVHRFPNILKLGETFHRFSSEQEIAELFEKSDPSAKRLTSVVEDGRNWNVVSASSKISFCGKEEKDERKKNQVFGFINNVWPGALNYYSDIFDEFGFIYFGFGLKSSEAHTLVSNFIHPINEDIKNIGLKDYKEPNPDEGQEVLETDSEPEVNSEKEDN